MLGTVLTNQHLKTTPWVIGSWDEYFPLFLEFLYVKQSAVLRWYRFWPAEANLIREWQKYNKINHISLEDKVKYNLKRMFMDPLFKKAKILTWDDRIDNTCKLCKKWMKTQHCFPNWFVSSGQSSVTVCSHTKTKFPLSFTSPLPLWKCRCFLIISHCTRKEWVSSPPRHCVLMRKVCI